MEANIIGMAGTVAAAPEKHHNIYGQENVYALWLDTLRDSGAADRILVLFKEEKVEPEHRAEIIEPGSRLEVTGEIQTYKDWETGRRQLFVWGKYLAPIPESSPQLNTAYIKGEVAKEPIYRETPKGRSITDLALRVPSAFAPGYTCIVPCIAWGNNAVEASYLEPGAPVYLEGRLQSREYMKEDQVYTTWEVSASKINTKE